MIKLFASAAALAIFISAAAAQTPSPPPPPTADQAGPNDEGPAGGPPPPRAERAGPGDEGPRARPRPPGPPPGAHVRVELGRDRGVDVKCDDREPFRACLDAAMSLLDKVTPMPGAETGSLPDWNHDRGYRRPMRRDSMSMSPVAREYMRSMHDMMQEMGESDFTGDPSHDFAAMMLPYSRSALTMAEALLRNENTDPQVRMLARKILQEHADNASQLEDWLKTRQR